MKKRSCDLKSRKGKKSKMFETSIIWHYAKLFLGWAALFLFDLMLDGRIELFWPAYVFTVWCNECRHLNGPGWTMLFISFTAVSDVIVYILLPLDVLFFVSCTYIWLYYIWYFEKGNTNLITIALVFSIILIELTYRADTLTVYKTMLFRPFAVHSISFAIISGLNISSIFTKPRNQSKKNAILHVEMIMFSENSCQCNHIGANDDECIHSHAVNITQHVDKHENHRKNCEKFDLRHEYTIHCKHHLPENICEKLTSHDASSNNKEKDFYKIGKNVSAQSKNKNSHNNDNSNQNTPSHVPKEKKNKANSSAKEDYQRLESQYKKVKLDLQIIQQAEVNLRSEINTLKHDNRSVKNELCKVHKHNEDLKSRLNSMIISRQEEKVNLSSVEKKLQEETKLKDSLQNKLQNALKKCNKKNDIFITRDECTENCRIRKSNLECENKRLRSDLKEKESMYSTVKEEADTAIKYKDKLKDYNLLLLKYSEMKEKNAHLEHSLRSETKIKLDLFSALGEVKRELDIRDERIKNQEKELEDLRYLITQYKESSSEGSSVANLTFDLEGDDALPHMLDPNAAVYTPVGLQTVSKI